MASTEFTREVTPIKADWLNDVNTATYHPADKAAAKLLPVSPETTLYILSEDGRGDLWRAVTGQTPSTINDNSVNFCGTEFRPTGGDGSSGWRRDYTGDLFPEWFGSHIDAASAIQAAANTAGSLGRGGIELANSYTLPSSIVLTSSHHNITIKLNQGTITKGFNGDIFTIAGALNFNVVGKGIIDGQQATYTGKGFVFTGASHYPSFGSEVRFLNFQDSPIEFGPDSGFRAKVASIFRNDISDHRAIHVSGPDTTAIFRDFSGISANGYIDLDGALDTTVNSGFVTRVEIDSASSITTVVGTVWGNAGGAVTISGTSTVIVGCRMSASITLDASMSGSFIANPQTSGGFVNNSLGANVLVYHHPLPEPYQAIGKHFISQGVSQAEIQLNQFNSLADSDFTWLPDSSPSILRLAATLTADRTVTLTTTDARAGMKIKIYRPGVDTGGPWNLAIGLTGKNLLSMEWCEVMYNGTSWELISFGSL